MCRIVNMDPVGIHIGKALANGKTNHSRSRTHTRYSSTTLKTEAVCKKLTAWKNIRIEKYHRQ